MLGFLECVLPDLNIEESRLLAIFCSTESQNVQGKHEDVLVKCITAIAPCPVRPTSLKLAKVNFPTKTVILFQLKYPIFMINKINSLSFKLENETKVKKHKQPKQTTQKEAKYTGLPYI